MRLIKFLSELLNVPGGAHFFVAIVLSFPRLREWLIQTTGFQPALE